MALIEEIDNDGASRGATAKPTSKMTEEERAALAEQMDKELDEFIDSLEKRGYTEGWPEDRWEEVKMFCQLTTPKKLNDRITKQEQIL